MKGNIWVVIFAFLVNGCASHSDDIVAAYVSPHEYAHFSCEQIQSDLQEIAIKITSIQKEIDEKAYEHKWRVGATLLFFFPAVFSLEGDNGAQESEYKLLKGQYLALSEQSKTKHCLDERTD